MRQPKKASNLSTRRVHQSTNFLSWTNRLQTRNDLRKTYVEEGKTTNQSRPPKSTDLHKAYGPYMTSREYVRFEERREVTWIRKSPVSA